MRGREKVYFVAEERKNLSDWPDLLAVERRLDALPIHNLPARLVPAAMTLSAAVRRYRGLVETTLRKHRQMDATAFMSCFELLGDLEWRLAETVGQLDREAKAYAAGEQE